MMEGAAFGAWVGVEAGSPTKRATFVAGVEVVAGALSFSTTGAEEADFTGSVCVTNMSAELAFWLKVRVTVSSIKSGAVAHLRSHAFCGKLLRVIMISRVLVSEILKLLAKLPELFRHTSWNKVSLYPFRS